MLLLEVIDAKFVGPVGVDVPGEDDGVGDFVILNVFQESGSFVGLAGPLVHGIVGGCFGAGAVGECHHDLLGEDVPGSLRRAHGIKKPLALGLAEEGVAGVGGGGVERTFSVVVRLVAAVLAGVENKEFRESAEASFAVERHVGADGKRGSAQGHHLVVGLIGIGAAD